MKWNYTNTILPTRSGNVLVTDKSGVMVIRYYSTELGWMHVEDSTNAPTPIAWTSLPIPAKPIKKSASDFKEGMSVWHCHREEWGEIRSVHVNDKIVYVRFDSEFIPKWCNFECLFFEAFEIPNSAKTPPALINLKGEEEKWEQLTKKFKL